MNLFRILSYQRITKYKYFYFKILENALEDLVIEAGFFCIFLDPDLDHNVALGIREESEYVFALETLGFSKEETRWLLDSTGFYAYRALERRKDRWQKLANEIWNDTTLSTRERHMKIKALDMRII